MIKRYKRQMTYMEIQYAFWPKVGLGVAGLAVLANWDAVWLPMLIIGGGIANGMLLALAVGVWRKWRGCQKSKMEM